MKAKTSGICLAVLAALLAALYVLSLPVSQAYHASLLLVSPSTFGTAGIDAQRLEDFSEEEFLLTYEIRKTVTAQAANSKHSAALIGTNHSYASLMGYPLLGGGFITKSAMDSKSKHAALNKTAAFQMFGSDNIAGSAFKIDGETWIVTGVLEDNDTENANIYVPATVAGGHAETIMALTDERFTEAYVKSALKSVGIHDAGYDFISLSKSANAFGERFSVAWKTALTAAVLLFILKSGKGLSKRLGFYRARLRELYPRELLACHRKDLLKTALGLFAAAAGIAAALALSLQILGTCLAWRDLTPITGALTAGDFGHKLLWLRYYQIPGNILFSVCICHVFLCFILAITGGRKLRRSRSRLYGRQISRNPVL